MTPTPPLALPALPEPAMLALIEEHLGLVPRRDNTVVDNRTGRWTDSARYFNLINAAILSDRAGRGDAAGCDQALKLLRYFDKHLGSVLQEHQFNVPGGGSLAAHNVRLGVIELHKLLASLPAAPTGEAL